MKMQKIEFRSLFIIDEILRNLKFEIMTSCSLKNGIKAKMCPRLRDDDTYVPPAQYEKDPFLRHQARVDSSTCEILTEIIEFFNVYSVRSVSRSIFLVSQRGATPLETTGDWSQQQSWSTILRAPSAPAAWIRKPFGTSPSLFLASQRIHPPWITYTLNHTVSSIQLRTLLGLTVSNSGILM